jgi:hypothetical protein
MRRMALLLAASLMVGGCVHAGVNGNDTAGIIPWSVEAELAAPELAAAHCARYDKVAYITTVNREPGYFINFICTFVRNGRPVRH